MTIRPREWRFVWLYALLVIAATSAPYIVAALSQGDGWQFSGFLFGVEDGYSYLGKMRIGARGLWDFFIFYTPEPHAPAPLVFLPYILPGQLAGLFLSDTDPRLAAVNALLFHLMRVGFGALLIVVLYRFIAVFIHAVNARRAALIVASIGGGFGWLLIPLGRTPPEFYLPEGFGFLILLGLPHLALARAALLGGLLALFVALTDSGRMGFVGIRQGVLAGGLWLVVGLSVPFYLVIVYAILGVWGVALWLRRRAFPARLALVGGVAAGITVPLFLYYFITFAQNPIFARWSAQNILVSPPPLDYLFAYLPLIIPALLGGRVVWRLARRRAVYALLPAWVLIVPLLIYLPLNVQRRMAEAVLVPLAVLAVLGVEAWTRGRALRRRSWRRMGRARAALTVAASISSVFFLFGIFFPAVNVTRPLFRPAAELNTFAWLNQNAPPDSVVLSAVPTGNALPAFTNLRTFMGHGPETLDWQGKTTQVERFYRNEMPADERAALLDTFDIRYIVYGELERALSPVPAWADDLTLIYDADGYQIYAAAPLP